MWAWGAIDGQAVTLEGISQAPEKTPSNRLARDSIQAMVGVMTQYYQDAANTDIPWKYMAVVASQKLSGTPESALQKKLEELRAYGAWLHQQNNSINSGGK